MSWTDGAGLRWVRTFTYVRKHEYAAIRKEARVHTCTHADDTVRGGTLYHRYCAKLLQGWGGELGTFKNTPDGIKFLASLEEISIKSIRQVIRKLIDQGLDKECPDRMDDQQLLVVMTATIRHMPLVLQLHTNTRVITKEIKHFRTIVKTIVNQVKVKF